MQRFQILHRTYYNFDDSVVLSPHQLRLRPREGPELRIESSTLSVTPSADIRWHRDVHDNAVATATFDAATRQLAIESTVVVEQYNENPFAFLTESHAVNFPFLYGEEERIILAPYLSDPDKSEATPFTGWADSIWTCRETTETLPLLLRLTDRIHSEFTYRCREEPGVQTPVETLSRRSGSCRDFAALFLAAARRFGLAARFVSGYLNTEVTQSGFDFGATHAWAEIYLPGAGWKGFDPTLNLMIGPDHIPVAVGRLPEAVPPVAGSYKGHAASSMTVGVWVTAF